MALLLTAAAAGCGGQSGNEGELPAAPCARNQAVVVGRIEAIGGGCVTVRVDRVAAAGEPLLSLDGDEVFDGRPVPNAALSGYFASAYAFRHEFRAGERVAAIIGTRGDMLSLELFPLDGDRVQARWAHADLSLTLVDLIAADCQSKLEAKYLPGHEERAPNFDGPHMTSPPTEEPVCRP